MSGKPGAPAEVRFRAKVDRSGGPDACWPWTAAIHLRSGYGQFVLRHSVRVYAHRYAWEDAYGPIPAGLLVLHHCDNPPCCNPSPKHLFLGTQAENMADMVSKGRDKPWNRGLPHCKNGHEWTPENTIIRQGQRACRECAKGYCRTYRRRKRALSTQ